jgi:hypothetical protein
MLKTKEKELIEELKRLRIERGFTYQEIADKTEENDEPVSLSTIKLVFSDRDTHQHDYKRMLKPIANVLLPFEDDKTESQIVQTILDYKNEIIRQLQERIDKKESRYRLQIQSLEEDNKFLKDQIRFKDSQIKRLNEAIDRKDAIIRKKFIESSE